jgi:hypothetical protein
LVPPDNEWHTLVFDVRASGVMAPPLSSGTDVDAALADVTQFRIFHSRFEQFNGEDATIEFYLDNIHALGGATVLPGDYNGNGDVDAADYVVWRTLNGQSAAGLAADGTGPEGMPDGVVNQLDYDFWRVHFGDGLSSGGHPHGASGMLAAVPEPATALLCGAATFALATACRKICPHKEPAN